MFKLFEGFRESQKFGCCPHSHLENLRIFEGYPHQIFKPKCYSRSQKFSIFENENENSRVMSSRLPTLMAWNSVKENISVNSYCIHVNQSLKLHKKVTLHHNRKGKKSREDCNILNDENDISCNVLFNRSYFFE